MLAFTSVLLAAVLMSAESYASAQASVRASVTVVDIRVGRAALEGAAEVALGVGGGAEPGIGGLEECRAPDHGVTEWSDGSGLFSVRLMNTHSEISADPHLRGAFDEPQQVEIQFIAN